MVKITNKTISIDIIFNRIKKESTTGAVINFIGIVKGKVHNKIISFMEIKAKDGAKEELKNIEREIKNRYKIEDIIIVRRTGKIKAGDIILVVAISSSNRKIAFSSCKYAIDKLKKMKNIEEKEI